MGLPHCPVIVHQDHMPYLGKARIINNAATGILFVGCTDTAQCEYDVRNFHDTDGVWTCTGCGIKLRIVNDTYPSVLISRYINMDYCTETVKEWLSYWLQVPVEQIEVTQK